VEIQIRTPEMHEHSENGIAAHWAYSEKGKIGVTKVANKEIEWVNQLKKYIKEVRLHEDLSNLKIDFFKNRIFVFTPRGEVKDLPESATPIDFAYAIHTDLGHSIEGAKVNGKMVALSYGLNNGDVVEILKHKIIKPSFDWLKIVKTNEARRKIRSWFNQLEPRKEELKKKKVSAKKIQIPKPKHKIQISEPLIQGSHGLLYKISKCCNPSLDDRIIGYLTVNRGVSIHTTYCSNIKNAPKERILNASWTPNN